MTDKKNIDLPVKYSETAPEVRKLIREQYTQEQNGLCYWCGFSLLGNPPKHITDKEIDWSRFPPLFLKYPVHLQHDHETDLTEGAVHAYCNAYMWQYEGR